MRLVLRRGRLEAQRAGALITSANDALSGNDQPAYWRFEHRHNVDGALRAAAGPALARACLELPRVEDSDVRRDIARWPGGCKRGASAPVRCPTGSAVATAASGDLDAVVVVHAVAPDVELTHGRYSGRYSGSSDDRDRLPEELLRGAYAAALAAAAAAATTAACPALGAGVKGWRPAISAAILVDALCRKRASLPADVDVFLGSDDAWVAFGKSFRLLLGAADEVEDDPKGPVAWRFDDDDARLPYDAAADTTVDLSAIPDLRPRPRRKNAGYAGDHWAPTDNGWG